MATNKMFTTVIQKTLDEFIKLEENSNLPKKFSIKAITDKMNEIVKTLKDIKEKKKGTGKKSVYNIYVQEQMVILKEELPGLSNSQRMTEIGTRWQKFKEDNPNYNELYEEKLKEANSGSEDEKDKKKKEDSDDDEGVVAKSSKKKEKKEDSDDDEDVVAKSSKKKEDSDDDEDVVAKSSKKKKKEKKK